MSAKQSKPSVVITTYARSGRDEESEEVEDSEQNGQQSVNHQEEIVTKEQLAHLFTRSHPSHPAHHIFKAASATTTRHRSKARYLSEIKGPTGSIRGHRDVVRKSLENIKSSSASINFGSRDSSAASLDSTSQHQAKSVKANYHCSLTTLQLDELHRRDYLRKLIDEEQGQCVAYVTSLGVIRRTFEDSKLMKTILNLNLIKFQERDIYLNQEYKQQLRMRCEPPVTIPALFVDGQLFGGIRELEFVNETGKFPLLLGNFKMTRAPNQVCHCCGNAKFIACQSCNGSRKSAIHHFKFNSVALRCIKCDKNGGLVQCPVCTSDNSFGLEESEENNNQLGGT